MRAAAWVGVGVLHGLVASAAGAQRVTPKFAWPANAVAEIRGEGYTIMEHEGRRDSTSRPVTSRLEVRAHPGGLLLRSGPTSGPAIVQSGSPTEAYSRATMPYVVSRDGVFRQFADTAAVKRHLDSTVQRMVARVPPMPPLLVESMRASMTMASLEATAKQSWDMLLGGILGRTWSPGDSARTVYPPPAPGSTRINIFSERITIYRGVVPCPAASGATTCWRFDTRSELDRSGMKESVDKMLAERGMTDATLASRIAIPRTVSSMQMIVDAATVRPLEVRTTAETGRSGSSVAGVNFEYSTRHHIAVTYRWKPLN